VVKQFPLAAEGCIKSGAVTTCTVEMDPSAETFVARLDQSVAIPISSWSELANLIAEHGVNELRSTVIAQVRWLVTKGDRPASWPLRWVVTDDNGQPLSAPMTVEDEASTY
jgi:hypothetical protein